MFLVSFSNKSALDKFLGQHGPKDNWRISGAHALWRADKDWHSGFEKLLGVESCIVDRRRSSRLTAAEINEALVDQGEGAMADWAPPFRLAWKRADGALCVGADACGLGHWFIWQGPDSAVACSSAAQIGSIFGLAADHLALAGLALTGSLIRDSSAVTGVQKLPTGRTAVLRDGKLALEKGASPSRLSEPATALKDAVGRLLAAYPDAHLELSGGWDSRLLSALIHSDPCAALAHRPKEGVTIGRNQDSDVIIARQIAEICHMEHTIIDPCADQLDSEELVGLIRDAASRDDYSSNPLDRAVLNHVNEARPPHPRINGQNGEFLRGFYYPGQRLDAMPTATLARQLISWRIISNDVVNPAVFDASWFREARKNVENDIENILLDYDSSNWAENLDEFYLAERMRRWFGTAATASLSARPILAPYFDADVIALGRALPAREKANSRYVARQITHLSSELSTLALDNGLTPAAVARDGWATNLRLGQNFVAKMVSRIRRKLRRRDRSTLGATAIVQLVMDQKLLSRIDTDLLLSTGMFDAARLQEICSGGVPVSRATAGFLMNTDFLLQRLSEGR
jgi:asparagine synthase (glutamine-hydrolysing)